MRQFYSKAIMSFVGLVIASLLVGYFCFVRTFLHVTLLPADQSPYPWRTTITSDIEQVGGQSQVNITDDKFNLSFDYKIVSSVQYPFITVSIEFTDANQPRLVDLTQFTSFSFNVKCSIPNTMSLAFLTFDDKVTEVDKLITYRGPSTYFSCNDNWNSVNVELNHLEIPEWWYELVKLDVAKKEYKLNKVRRINFGNSFQSPRNINSTVQIHDIQLHGRNWNYLYLFIGFMLLAWSAYGFWFFRQYTRAMIRELQDKLQRDRPLVAYQQLSLEPHRDKDKSSILRFMATEYANPDLNLDSMGTAIGVSRTKINDTLKAELGYTFTAYLNKLRLTEAARLLSEKDEANVAEIAYSVGYRNVSYFNKLFKEEYGCTPKTFKGLRGDIQGEPPAP